MGGLSSRFTCVHGGGWCAEDEEADERFRTVDQLLSLKGCQNSKIEESESTRIQAFQHLGLRSYRQEFRIRFQCILTDKRSKRIRAGKIDTELDLAHDVVSVSVRSGRSDVTWRVERTFTR